MFEVLSGELVIRRRPTSQHDRAVHSYAHSGGGETGNIIGGVFASDLITRSVCRRLLTATTARAGYTC
jgi:hypothetical protein